MHGPMPLLAKRMIQFGQSQMQSTGAVHAHQHSCSHQLACRHAGANSMRTAKHKQYAHHKAVEFCAEVIGIDEVLLQVGQADDLWSKHGSWAWQPVPLHAAS